MNYLAIDTCTDICSVTFCYNSVINTVDENNVKEHSKYLPLICKDLIENNLNEINYIFLSIGPGSYSGLKTSCSFAKGLSYALNLPIVPVNTFEGMNLLIKDNNKYFISLHSHRDFSFFQLFDSGKSIEKARCSKISNMKNYKVYGYGLNDKISKDIYFEIRPNSKNIGMIGMKKINNLSKFNINNISPILLSAEK